MGAAPDPLGREVVCGMRVRRGARFPEIPRESTGSTEMIPRDDSRFPEMIRDRRRVVRRGGQYLAHISRPHSSRAAVESLVGAAAEADLAPPRDVERRKGAAHLRQSVVHTRP